MFGLGEAMIDIVAATGHLEGTSAEGQACLRAIISLISATSNSHHLDR